MATLIPAGSGIASFLFGCVGKADDLVVTLGFKADVVDDPEECANLIHDAWTLSNLRPFHGSNINTGYTFRGVKVVVEAGGEPLAAQKMVSQTGSLSGDPMPVNCAVLVRKNTSRGGRKGRGRMYLPPCFFGESGVDPAGGIVGSLVTGLDTKLEAARAAMATGFLPPQLLHADGTAGNEITSFSTQSVIATQRRRLR